MRVFLNVNEVVRAQKKATIKAVPENNEKAGKVLGSFPTRG